jgi:mono/diheme cytochrome c family protein
MAQPASATPPPARPSTQRLSRIPQSKASDDELIAAVKNGKGKMPPNNGRLTDAQINAVIAYIRTLQK